MEYIPTTSEYDITEVLNLFLDQIFVRRFLAKIFDKKLDHLHIDTYKNVKFMRKTWDVFIDKCGYYYCSCYDDENPTDDYDGCCNCEINKNFNKSIFGKFKNYFEAEVHLKEVYCVIKTSLSNDYVDVLRQMNMQIEITQETILKENNRIRQKWKSHFKKTKDPDDYHFFLNQELIVPNYILLIKDFSSPTTSKEQLIKIFDQSNIKVIFLKDITYNI